MNPVLTALLNNQEFTPLHVALNNHAERLRHEAGLALGVAFIWPRKLWHERETGRVWRGPDVDEAITFLDALAPRADHTGAIADCAYRAENFFYYALGFELAPETTTEGSNNVTEEKTADHGHTPSKRARRGRHAKARR